MLDIEPPASVPFRGAVVCVQPIGEEANLSRRVIVAMGARLAAAGWLVSIPDLFGCGDSDGESDSPDLATWQTDLTAFADRVDAMSPTPRGLAVWGVRHGCHLAVDLVVRRRTAGDALVLWQPGRPTARIPAGAVANGRGIVTVQGYRYRADLVRDLDALPLAPFVGRPLQ